MDQLDDEYMEDAQLPDPPGEDADRYDDAGGHVQHDDDPGATLREPGVPNTPQVARRLDRQFPEEHSIHTPVPPGARTRSARGQGPRVSPNATPLAPAPTYDPPLPRHKQPAPEHQPTLQNVFAAIAQSRTDTISRLDDLSKLQHIQTGQIKALDERTIRTQQSIDADRATAEPRRPTHAPATEPWMSTTSTVSLQGMQATIAPILHRANVPATDAELQGSQMGRSFTLRQRPSARGHAEDMVNAIMAAHRLPDGPWAKAEIQTPYGASLPVFVERDKSHAQRKTGYHLARVARTLRAAFPDKTFEVSRSSGIVTQEWCEVAQVRYNANANAADIEWRDETITSLGGTGDAMRDAYKAMLAAARASSVGSRG